MINSYDLPEPLSRSTFDPHLSTCAAGLRVADLRAEAEAAQLARQYRKAHPELSIRYRAAVALRHLADRIAPPASTTTPRPKVVRL